MMAQAVAAQGVVGAHHAGPPSERTHAPVLLVHQILVVREGDVLGHQSLQQRTVVSLHLGKMAKENVMLVRQQGVYIHLFDSEKNVAVLNILHHGNVGLPVLLIGESTDRAGLHHELMLRILSLQIGHLDGRQSHTAVGRSLGLSDKSDFHIVGKYIFTLF